MEHVILAAGIWVMSHLGLSSTRLRPLLVSRLGEQGFLGIYSLVALASIGYLIWAYMYAQRFEYFWLPNIELNWIPKLTMSNDSQPTYDQLAGARCFAKPAAEANVAVVDRPRVP